MFVVLFAAPALAQSPGREPAVGETVAVGKFSVVPLLDGSHNFPLSVFHGADEATMLQVAGAQSVSGSFNVFLIKRGLKIRYLVDTGNGVLRAERNGRLLPCLNQAGTAPADISNIFLTHLHSDHIGGLVRDGKPVFPKAKVHVAKAEYDYWMNDESMRQAPVGRQGLFPVVQYVLRVLEQHKLLVSFTPGKAVAPGVTSVDLPGHTPGHVGFLLTDKGNKLLFVGDIVHGAALQFPRPDITFEFDVDQARARETRLRVFKQLAAEQTPIAAAHLPFPGVGFVEPDGGGYRLEPLK
jgi:glyoxylase-like metal-dependent hydrolase (beta-lactamase superfamily II)